MAAAKRPRRWRRLWWLLALPAAALVVLTVYWQLGKPAPRDFGQTAAATRGPLTISITEDGELETQVVTKISNELPWPVVILDLQPQGTFVRKDIDWIIKFECRDLTEAVDKQLLSLAGAQAAETQSRQKLDLTRKQMANKVSKAKQAVIDAKANQERYVKADWPVALKDAQSELDMANKDLLLAKAKLEFKERVNADPELNSPYSGNEIEADRLAVARLHRGVEKSEAQLKILIDFEHPKKERELKSAVTDAELDLQSSELEASSQIASDEASLREREATLKKVQEQLKDLQDKQRKLTVIADRDGLIVYSPGGQGWRRRSDIVLEKGAKIPEFTQLMIIPDMNTLRVRTKVYESMIDQVKPGQKAYVRLEGRPGQVLDATVSEVGELPDQSNWWSPDVKIFNVYLTLDHPDQTLKPGMTCQAEMILRELDDKTLSLPVASVFSRQDRNYVWLASKGEAVKTPVKIGLMSQTRVQILEGLKEGDVVLLTEPKGTPEDEAGGKPRPQRQRGTTRPSSGPSSVPTVTSAPTSTPATVPTSTPATAPVAR